MAKTTKRNNGAQQLKARAKLSKELERLQRARATVESVIAELQSELAELDRQHAELQSKYGFSEVVIIYKPLKPPPRV